jgi:hypothetical protein
MKTNTPSADALMSSIRNQFPRESEEQHRKRFIEMVRNGDWKIREEIVKSLFAVYVNRAYAFFSAEANTRTALSRAGTAMAEPASNLARPKSILWHKVRSLGEGPALPSAVDHRIRRLAFYRSQAPHLAALGFFDRISPSG